MPISRVCLFLIAAGLLLAPLACGGKAGKKPPKPAKAASEQGQEKPAGPSPAVQALEAMLKIPADAPAEKKVAALATGYLQNAARQAVKARDALVLQAGSSDMDELIRKKFRELMGGGAIPGGNVQISGDELLKEFNKKADEQSQAVFGADRSEIVDAEPEELRDLWLARKENWENKILPDLKGRFPAGERDLGDRLYLSYEGGGRKVEIAMMRERGGYKYAGTWDERNDYLLGPERILLFDGKTDAERLEAAQNELSELQSALLKFRQKQERYPTGLEGLDALLENPGGLDAHRWEGPYAHHIVDPWGNRWRLDVPGKHNPGSFDLWSAGPDGRDGTTDDLKNW